MMSTSEGEGTALRGMTRVAVAVTLIGTDRPGLIDQVATVAAEQGASWLESHMANLCGQFAGIVHLEVSADGRSALRAALDALSGSDLRVTVVDADAATIATGDIAMIEITGHDRPGIVRDIAHVLAARGVSIDSLETMIEDASMSGESLFRAEARLRVPEGMRLEEVEAVIEALSGELMVDTKTPSPA